MRVIHQVHLNTAKVITYIILRIQSEIVSIFIPSQKVRTERGEQVRLIQLNETYKFMPKYKFYFMTKERTIKKLFLVH